MMRAQVREHRVPRIMICLGVLTMLFLPFLVAPAHAAPRVVVDKPVFDFGELPQGQKIAHAFILKNAGDADLTIHVKPC
jgi:hypothetical protein